MQPSTPHTWTRTWVTAGIALVGAGAVAVTPVSIAPAGHPAGAAHLRDIVLTAGGAADAVDITLDFVRHGQSTDNVDKIIGTLPPGAPLTEEGEGQAITVGNLIYNHGDNDINGAAGVYASELLRTQQTAWPLLQLLLGNPPVTQPSEIPDGPVFPQTLPDFDSGHILSGLNEVDAGLLENSHENALTDIAYLLPTVAWIFGLYFVPMLGAEANPNGAAFEDRVNDAIQTIYTNTANPADEADGKLTDAVFSHAGTISTWALMNVKNPDFGPVLHDLVENHIPLTNTGQVVVEGNPTDGWTLVSWDGTAVPQTPGLLTGLFVDVRNLITAPQMALWHLISGGHTGDADDATQALANSFHEVTSAYLQFPESVYNTVVDALQNLGTDAGGQTAGAAGGAATDALAAI